MTVHKFLQNIEETNLTWSHPPWGLATANLSDITSCSSFYSLPNDKFILYGTGSEAKLPKIRG